MKKIRLNESQFNRLVSKCVKKALNESEMSTNNVGYEIVSIYLDAEKDDYNEGCNGERYSTSMDAPRNVFKTLNELVEYVKNKCIYNDEVDAFAWEDSEILFSYMADSNWSQLSQREIDAWKQGQNDDVYACSAYVKIRKVVIDDVSIEEMVQNGLSEY